MSEQALKKILITLAVLVGLWGVSSVWSGRGGERAVSEGGRVAAALDGLDATSVEALQISGPLADLSFRRETGDWTVNGFATDSSALDRLWQALAEAEVGRVAATNPSNHERMGVSADSAWTLRITRSSGDTETILLGKSGPAFPSAYARVADDDEVVVVSGDLRSAVARGLLQWRDKTMLQADTAAVSRVVIQADGETLTLDRSDGVWMLDGEAVSELAMGNVLSEFHRMVATGFVEGPVAQGDTRHVTAFDAAGDTLLSVEITGQANSRHARVSGSDVIYEIPVWRVDRIAPKRDALKPPEEDLEG